MKNPYRVEIYRDEGKLYGNCNCPYDLACKHMVAAVMQANSVGFLSDWFDSTDDQPIVRNDFDDELLDRDDFFDEDSWDDEEFVPSWDSNNSRIHPLISTLKSRYKENHIGKNGKIYKLCFCFQMDRNFSQLRNGMPWLIDPQSRYIKKDGQPGRVYRYQPNHRLVNCSEAELAILNKVLVTEDRRIDALAWTPFCFDHTELLLYMESRTRNDSCLLQRERIIDAQLTFSFNELGSESRYHPVIMLFDRDNARYPLDWDPSRYGFIFSGPRFFILDAKAKYIFDASELSHDLKALIQDLSYTLLNFNYDSILELKELVPSTITVIPPPKKREYHVPRPTMEIYINSNKDLTLRVKFRYGDKVFDSNNTEMQWNNTDLSTDELYVLNTRNIDAEGQFYHDLESLELIPQQYSLTPQFSWDGNLVSLLSHLCSKLPEFVPEEEFELYINNKLLDPSPAKTIRIESRSGIDWINLDILDEEGIIELQNMDLTQGFFWSKNGYRQLSEQDRKFILELKSLSLDPDQLIIHSKDLAAADLIEQRVSSNLAPNFEDLFSLRNTMTKNLSQTYRCPLGFSGLLRSYQEEGYVWMRALAEAKTGGILADDMGLGKTIQAIALMAYYREKGEHKPIAVCAPVSTLNNWYREIHRFFPQAKINLHQGSERERISPEGGILLTSYQTLVRDLDLLSNTEFCLLVLDEGQQFKNNRTKVFKAVRSLKAFQKLILSGTPVENSLLDLWSLMEVAVPGLLGPSKKFKNRYLGKRAQLKEDLEGLQRRIKPFLLRRTKEMVAKELPEKEEIVIYVSLSKQERYFYAEQERICQAEVLKILEECDPSQIGIQKAIAILQSITHLRLCAVAPELRGGPPVSAKIDLLLEKILEAESEDHSILVFSQFVKVLDIIKARLKEKGILFSYLDGSLTSNARKKAIDSFNQQDRIKTFLLSLKAGGVGINLVKADHVFIVDPWWNPAVENQAIDRSHRIGQERKVLATRFIVENTLEEKVLQLQEQKKDLIDNFIGAKQSVFSSLKPEEILGLFQNPLEG
jgi:SNF2 family DNA or RNA helicase